MAGTMPHAVFVETDLDGQGLVAAYAAELPGCASFAETDEEAVGAIPRRVAQFTEWLQAGGEAAPSVVGDNWYEVERAAGSDRRVSFSLDELPPSAEEFGRYLRWLELAREELAAALDAIPQPGAVGDLLRVIERQDVAFTRELEGQAPELSDDPVDRLYAARDALTEALEAGGAQRDGVRRILRIAIADDLRAAGALRERGAAG